MFTNGGNEAFRAVRDGKPADESIIGYRGKWRESPISNFVFNDRAVFEKAVKRMHSQKARLAKGETSSFFHFIFVDPSTKRTLESVLIEGGVYTAGGRRHIGRYRAKERMLFAYTPEDAKRLQEEEVPARLTELLKAEPETGIDYLTVLANPKTGEIVSTHRIFSQNFKSNPQDFFVGKNGNGKEQAPSEAEFESAVMQAKAVLLEKIMPEIEELARAQIQKGAGVDITVRAAKGKRDISGAFQLPVNLRTW